MTQKIDIGILGADGRMGCAVIQAMASNARTRLRAALTAPNAPTLGQDVAEIAGLKPQGVVLTSDMAAGLASCDVLIDFSAPEAGVQAAEIAAQNATRCQVIISGTTGHTPEQEARLIEMSKKLTLLRSGNFSLGVNMLEVLVEHASRALVQGWDIDVLEMHHKHKVDAPSGTALMLGAAAARGRGVRLDDVRAGLRDGVTGARRDGEIGFAALRGGGVIGQHEVRIASELEMITLSHDAFDRSVFARGAVTAALWASNQPAGLYDMKSVLGL